MTSRVPQRLLDRIALLSPLKKRLLHEKLCASGVDSPSRGGRLVAFYQAREQLETDKLRELCADHLPAHMVPQRFVYQESLARTPTGKLDRQAMRVRAWTRSSESASGGHELTSARNEVESALCEIWSDVLGLDEISVFDNFFEIGGDSLQIIRILSRVSKAGMSIKPDAIFTHSTIAELARVAGGGAGDDRSSVGSEPVADYGDLPLMPIQSWFFDVVNTHHHHWNQSYLFCVDKGAAVTTTQIEQAAALLLEKHAGLRSCFFNEDGQWFAQIAESMDADITTVAIDGMDDTERLAAMSRAADDRNATFSLSDGPLIRMLCFTENDRVRYLGVIAHHLIVDAVSWGLIITDMQTYLQSGNENSVNKSTSLKQWSEALDALADGAQLAGSLRYWEEHAMRSFVELPLDTTLDTAVDVTSGGEIDKSKRESNTEGDSKGVSRTLDAVRSERLRADLPGELRCSVQELLLTALVKVLSGWMQSSTVTLDLEGHGREAVIAGLDVSSTVGWCTSVFPVSFHAERAADWSMPQEALRQIKTQLRAVPENGLSHGLFRYGKNASNVLRDAPRSKLLFNYLGVTHNEDVSGPLVLEDAMFGTARHPLSQRAYELELNTAFKRGELVVHWAYGPGMHSRATIERLADELIFALVELVDKSAAEVASVTPTDFPMSGLDQSALDNLSSQLDDLEDE